MTRVSIVVNNYNYERFLRSAVESALAQTHPDVEVIVVDDGSTDGSAALIDTYGDRVTPLLKANGGQTSALNAAFHHVTGDVVIFLDADDLLHPTAAARAVELLSPPGAVKAHWPLDEIDADGRPLGSRSPAEPLPSGDLRAALLHGGPEACAFPPTSGNAFAAAFLQAELPLPDVATRIGSASADAHLSMVAAVEGRVEASEEPLGAYRVHGANGFAGRPLRERIAHNLARFDERCEVLAHRLRAHGLDPDPAAWRRASWVHRVWDAKKALEQVVPREGRFILVDQGEWGPDLVGARDARPFVERDGEWWGPPPDDRAAIDELERQRREGAGHAAFGWPAFWWLDHYTGLRDHLERRYPEVLRTESLRVFELS